jgi:hypothetical protein
MNDNFIYGDDEQLEKDRIRLRMTLGYIMSAMVGIMIGISVYGLVELFR